MESFPTQQNNIIIIICHKQTIVKHLLLYHNIILLPYFVLGKTETVFSDFIWLTG